MNVEENLRVIDAFVDAFNEREWDRVAKLHAATVVYWTPDNSEPKKGRRAIRNLFSATPLRFLTPETGRNLRSAKGIGLVRSTCLQLPTGDLSRVQTGKQSKVRRSTFGFRGCRCTSWPVGRSPSGTHIGTHSGCGSSSVSYHNRDLKPAPGI